MTRFLLDLQQAVDTLLAAVRDANRGETYIPRIPSARVIDIAKTLIGNRQIKIETIGIRPGEKVHEILVSEEERFRTVERNNYYVILAILPELRREEAVSVPLSSEYSSADHLMDKDVLEALLQKHKLMVEDVREPVRQFLP
jgi:UDP-glucose 4-epimerase